MKHIANLFFVLAIVAANLVMAYPTAAASEQTIGRNITWSDLSRYCREKYPVGGRVDGKITADVELVNVARNAYGFKCRVISTRNWGGGQQDDYGIWMGDVCARQQRLGYARYRNYRDMNSWYCLSY